MITKEKIPGYQGKVMFHGGNILLIPPHRLLAPYISNYTITCPLMMAQEYRDRMSIFYNDPFKLSGYNEN